jgi:hypothetical protein
MKARISMLLLAAGMTVTSAIASAALAQTMNVYKSASCGCCKLWIRHIEKAGFTARSQDLAAGQLARLKADAKLSPDLQSCHTAKIDGYVIEGHVPPADIRRLLAEKPDAIGLTVPGMPLGSPGMEAGGEKEPYQVMLVRRDGTTEVFSKY